MVRKQLVRTLVTVAAAAALTIPFLPTAFGQFPAESTIPKAKRNKNSRVKRGPAGPVPKTADGKVDFTGMWGYAGYTSDIAKDYDVGELPMTPLADKLFKERQANEGVDDPEARCLPTGVPRRDPYPMKMLQTPKIIAILFEGNIHSFRQIFMDAKHPAAKDLDPTWYGHSVGKFDGDVLEVDTIGFNGKTWLDMAGHGSSEQLHVVERYTREDYGNLRLDITIEDPVYYTRPFKVTERMPLMEKDELFEYICTENNKDVEHLDKISAGK